MESIEILLSCMQLDKDIAALSGIDTDVLIINQCDENRSYSYPLKNGTARVICSTERGLTKSRNLAIDNSKADICLLCDDDESFCKDYYQKLEVAYKALPKADIIIFDMLNTPKRFGNEIKRLSYFDIMKVSSWQISFRKESLNKAGIRFDENMGAGTPNGAEEEFKLLSDCRKAGLAIYHYPAEIASVAQQHSTWRNGYDERFFINRGNTTRYIMGLPMSVLYAVYYCLTKANSICKELGAFRALRCTFKGIRENRFKKGNLNG